MTSNRFAVLAVVALLAVIVVAGLLAATQSSGELDPRSPAGVVQRYVAAVMDGDHDLAVQYFAADTTCDAEDLDRTYVDPASRVDLLATSIDDSRAHVRIGIEVGTDALLGNTWTDERTIRLTKSDGQWQITGIPWPLYECGVWSK